MAVYGSVRDHRKWPLAGIGRHWPRGGWVTVGAGVGDPSGDSRRPDRRAGRSLGGPAAVDEKGAAGDETRGIRGEEDGGAGDLVQIAPAAHGNPGDEGAVLLRVVQQWLVHVGGEGAGADGVDRDALGSPFECEDARE